MPNNHWNCFMYKDKLHYCLCPALDDQEILNKHHQYPPVTNRQSRRFQFCVTQCRIRGVQQPGNHAGTTVLKVWPTGHSWLETKWGFGHTPGLNFRKLEDMNHRVGLWSLFNLEFVGCSLSVVGVSNRFPSFPSFPSTKSGSKVVSPLKSRGC